jgi:hypothetical protein
MEKVSGARPQLTQVFCARPQSELRPMPVGMVKTLVTVSNQLHQQLEGEIILVDDIPKMDIPLDYFF